MDGYEISLREYEGKTIHIAFVNDSEDKATLYIDDITVGVYLVLKWNQRFQGS